MWAPAATIDQIRADLEAERSTESFAKKKETDTRRREKAQAEYVEDFHRAVVKFLAFQANYADLAQRMARAIADHATLVGSGTVARTKRIPVEQRAEAAVIAWMRHKKLKATGYDGTITLEVFAPQKEYLLLSRDLLRRWWGEGTWAWKGVVATITSGPSGQRFDPLDQVNALPGRQRQVE